MRKGKFGKSIDTVVGRYGSTTVDDREILSEMQCQVGDELQLGGLNYQCLKPTVKHSMN